MFINSKWETLFSQDESSTVVEFGSLATIYSSPISYSLSTSLMNWELLICFFRYFLVKFPSSTPTLIIWVTKYSAVFSLCQISKKITSFHRSLQFIWQIQNTFSGWIFSICLRLRATNMNKQGLLNLFRIRFVFHLFVFSLINFLFISDCSKPSSSRVSVRLSDSPFCLSLFCSLFGWEWSYNFWCHCD